MTLADAVEHVMGPSTMPSEKSIGFVVDDDISVRESLESNSEHPTAADSSPTLVEAWPVHRDKTVWKTATLSDLVRMFLQRSVQPSWPSIV